MLEMYAKDHPKEFSFSRNPGQGSLFEVTSTNWANVLSGEALRVWQSAMIPKLPKMYRRPKSG